VVVLVVVVVLEVVFVAVLTAVRCHMSRYETIWYDHSLQKGIEW
jgi:hypothetical protein